MFLGCIPFIGSKSVGSTKMHNSQVCPVEMGALKVDNRPHGGVAQNKEPPNNPLGMIMYDNLRAYNLVPLESTNFWGTFLIIFVGDPKL